MLIWRISSGTSSRAGSGNWPGWWFGRICCCCSSCWSMNFYFEFGSSSDFGHLLSCGGWASGRVSTGITLDYNEKNYTYKIPHCNSQRTMLKQKYFDFRISGYLKNATTFCNFRPILMIFAGGTTKI